MNKIANDKVIYPELSYQIMQAVYEVHNKLGPGFTEDIYEEATVIELEALGLIIERQKSIENFGSKRVESVRIVN